MNTSEQINEIAAALAKAQGELQNVAKDAKNSHFGNNYATLDAITDAVRPVFATNGLAVVQIPSFADGVVTVETLVTHTSGQWLRGATSAPVAKADPQGVGSATTYLRRYSLAAIAALAQTDDDGNAASGNTTQKAQPVEPQGFAEWWAKLQTVADKGEDALREAWKTSDAALRDYLTAAHTAKWESLKKRAAKVKPNAA